MTGHLPFEGEAVGDVLVKLCTAPLPVPSHYAPDLPPGFDAWFSRALSREPEGRFQSAAELSQSLAAVCGLSVQTMLPGDSTGGSSPNIRVRVSSAATPYTPTPMGVTTPSPVLGRGPQITGAPITQTPAPKMKGNRSGLVLGGVTLLVLLGIGAGVLAKVLGAGDAPAAPTAAADATKPEVAPMPKPVEPPVPEAKTPPVAVPLPASPPSATAVPPESTVLAQPKQQKRPAGRPSGKAKPQPSAKPGVKPVDDIGF
jgi:serine/threonine-protein kinase